MQSVKRLLPVLILICLSVAVCAKGQTQDYGVFLSIDGEEISRLDRYRTVVIEPSAFSAGQMEQLHAAGKTVYGYLNVGAIEEYRPYYDRFRELALGRYENWPDEHWIDVSSPQWQRFVVDELGKQYAGMGLDGFLLDNADVYYHFPSDHVFLGLCAILRGLKEYGLPLVINGGDVFVSRCMDEKTALTLFDGINQETVFTRIDFENNTYGRQSRSETEYFKEYLSRAKEHGLSVCLLEYRASPALSRQIDAWCSENGFLWYNAKDKELR